MSLQQQNALLQQQNAVQTAVQQATAVLQGTAVLQSANLASQQAKLPNRINLQQQQTALQIAIQETMALLQASYRQNNSREPVGPAAVEHLAGALQQTISLQESLPSQGGKLTTYQLQLLSQEQTSLMGLLTPQPPPLPGRTSRR